MVDLTFSYIIIAQFIVCSSCFAWSHVNLWVCVRACARARVWCSLVRLFTARGSLLRQCMPVFHFLPFVFETLEPVSESLSACIDAQLHSACQHRSINGGEGMITRRHTEADSTRNRGRSWSCTALFRKIIEMITAGGTKTTKENSDFLQAEKRKYLSRQEITRKRGADEEMFISGQQKG